MLQQTRIAVVIPAYRRFLRAFPSIAVLARAEEEQVLSLWSGLGYYSRARALHRAARALDAARERSFPRTMEAARRLPGVGPYIAAAVLSIAYDLPHAAIDGNVVRVLSRLSRLPRPDARGEPHAAYACGLLDRRRPGDWNQALMELGETICTPQAPRCGECPLRRHCQAHRHGEVHLHPSPRPRRAVERLRLELTVARDRSGRILLERGAFPYLPHLWLPPVRVVAAESGNHRAPAAGSFRHAILHRAFEVDVYAQVLSTAVLRRRIRARGAPAIQLRLFEPDELRRIGRSSLLTKALATAEGRPTPPPRPPGS